MGGRAFRGRSATGFLLGVEFADGRTGSNVSGRIPFSARFGDDLGSDEILLVPGGGGGGGRSFDTTIWLSPLPPPGPVTLISAWPRVGMQETETMLDGAALAEAGAQAEVLWPWEPEPDPEDDDPDPSAPPELPGWFGRLARRRQ
jgi:hypothetical protein